LIVTIDGPVAAGKTTIARELAIRLGFTLLDTGAIYRCVALASRRLEIAWDDEPRLAELAREIDVVFELRDGTNHVILDGADVSSAIREPEISEGASIVSALPKVRQALLELQRAMAAQGRMVVEGRDTGTVVFPQADAKFFLTADPEVRARRRHRELVERHDAQSQEDVLAALKERDTRDTTRAVAPLVAADDARVIDSTNRDIEEILDEVSNHLRSLGAG
jgi:cytidylate kinase